MSAPAIRPGVGRSPGGPQTAPRGAGQSCSPRARTTVPSSGPAWTPPGDTLFWKIGWGPPTSTTRPPGIARRSSTTRCSRHCPLPGAAMAAGD
eukprot:8245917-Alexandrium_andersonii.AAC.1